MAEDNLAHRLGQLTLRTAAGVDPGPVSEEEWRVFARFIRSAVPNWQRIGLLPRTQDPLDLTPTDVMNRYRRWASLEALRLDPSIGWQDGQSLGALLKTCGDRLPRVQAALRKAGIELPAEWEPPGEPA